MQVNPLGGQAICKNTNNTVPLLALLLMFQLTSKEVTMREDKATEQLT